MGAYHTILRWAVRGTAVTLAGAAVIFTMGAVRVADDSHPADATASAFQPVAADQTALAELAQMQDPATGLWPIAGTSGWWSSANDLTALIDASRALGTHQYDSLIARTYADYSRPAGGYPFRDFTNHYYDDSLWWGLAWLDAYQWTGDTRYLVTAEADDAYAHDARTTTACGTAIPWAMSIIRDGGQFNAITNELGLELSAQLATVTGRSTYRSEALADWAWLQRSGLIGADGLVRDHLDVHCRPTGPAWSYTQGTISSALVSLSMSTGMSGYLSTARHLADTATTSSRLNPGGVLTDPCELGGWCVVDGATFKGADIRGLAALNRALPDHPHSSYLTHQATTMYEDDRMAGDVYGQHWAGAPDASNPARQGSAVDLLTATMEGA